MAGGRGERSMLTYQHGTAAIVGPLSVHGGPMRSSKGLHARGGEVDLPVS